MHLHIITFVLLAIFPIYILEASSFGTSNIVFVILSQSEPYHASVAVTLKEDIQNKIFEIEQSKPNVHSTYEDCKVLGSWAIMPLLGPLASLYRGTEVRWVVFVESHTAVRYRKLLNALAEADKDPFTKWIGHPLRKPSLMEEDGGFTYTNFGTGFATRLELIETLLLEMESNLTFVLRDDPIFELATLLKRQEEGETLASDLQFCMGDNTNCTSYPGHFVPCGSPIREDSIYFAVKTWSGNHATRVPIIKKTWGKHITNLAFYSDEYDPSIPTIEFGVPNVKDGHCSTTLALLKKSVEAVKHLPHVLWIFLTDDDTIVGVHRLCKLLSCYLGGMYLTVLGERHGLCSGDTQVYEYDFLMGGAGIAMSVGAARALTRCSCASDNFPDDLMLSLCAGTMGMELTHTELFHQEPPTHYSKTWLAHYPPVTFHSSTDAAQVYAAWFQKDDQNLKRKDQLEKDEL